MTAPALCNVAEELRMVDLSESLVERLEWVARVDADVERRVVLVQDVVYGLSLFVLALLGQIGELNTRPNKIPWCDNTSFHFLCLTAFVKSHKT